MPPLPRTTCHHCGRNVPVRRNGDLREHKTGVSMFPGLRPGSGQPARTGDR